MYRVGGGRTARKFRKGCTILRGNRERTEKYEYCSTVPRTFVQDCRLILNFLCPLACATDETKLWLSPSAKQRRNPCSRPPPVYQDLNTRHDWPVKRAIVDLPIRMKGNSKRTSSNSFSPLGRRTRILALLRRRYLVGLN